MPDAPRSPSDAGQTVSYDFPALLQYRGPSSREPNPDPSGVGILDFRNSDDNEHKIAVLLSSQGIPFHIQRPGAGWSQPKVRLMVIVPERFLDSAQALLRAASQASIIEAVEGLDGLP